MEKEERPDLAAVIEYYAQQAGRDVDLSRVRVTGNNNIKCPFHEDHVASAVINLDRGRFRCYACSAPAGDSLDLIMGMEGVGFSEARRWAADHLGYEGAPSNASPRSETYRPSWIEPDD